MSIIKATLFEPYLPSSYDKPEYQSTFLHQSYNSGNEGDIYFTEKESKEYKKLIDSLLNQVTEDESALMGFDPDYGPSLAELENMIVWYEEYEEYERCGRLHEILKSKYP